MQQFNQVTRVLGVVATSLFSLLLVKELISHEGEFEKYVVYAAALSLTMIFELGKLNAVGHFLTEQFSRGSLEKPSAFWSLLKDSTNLIFGMIIAFATIIACKEMWCWWLVVAPILAYFKRCLQVIEQSAFHDYRYWLRELLASILKGLMLYALVFADQLSFTSLILIILIADTLFVVSYLPSLPIKGIVPVVFKPDHISSYRKSFVANFFSNQVEGIFPIVLLNGTNTILWGALLPFASLVKQGAGSLMASNFAYIHRTDSVRSIVRRQVLVVVVLSLIGFIILTVSAPTICSFFDGKIDNVFPSIRFFVIGYFFVLMLSNVFGDWLRKWGDMQFVRVGAVVGPMYIVLFCVSWLLGLTEELHYYFWGKLVSSSILLFVIIHGFAKNFRS